MENMQEVATLKGYKYKITQCADGARIAVHGDTVEDTVKDYARLRKGLEEEGFKIASED